MEVFLNYVIVGNTVYDYLIMLGIALVLYVLLMLFRGYLLKKAILLAEKTQYKRDDLIVKKLNSISRLFYIVVLIYIPLQYINIHPTLDRIVYICFLSVILREISNVFVAMLKYVLDHTMYKNKSDKKDVTKINLFYLIAKIFIYIIVWLFLLSNLWIEVTPLIASLWVLWIWVAFALQKILWDIFASFSIFFDRPFEIWNFVVIGEDSGIVKDIGIKSTRIQTLQWQELIVPNSEMTEIRINNYGKMKKRRASFDIGVVYHTDPWLLEKIPDLIKTIIDKTENAEFDRTHFVSFGPSSLNFEVVYYIWISDFRIYKDVHQSIWLNIIKLFKKKWIEFAYPTQSLYIKKQ